MKILIAAGGTGGHLFPGIALAEEFLRRDKENSILFTGSGRDLEKNILTGRGFQLKQINVEGIKGKGVIKVIKALLKIFGSIVQSSRIIRNFSPDVVIGVGGYASGPVVIAAHFAGIKTVITEQNVIPGMTNRILGKFVDKACITFFETARWFSQKKVELTGNPIRSGFSLPVNTEGRRSAKFTIFIFGGSQGAHSINMAMLDSLGFFEQIKDSLKIIHQTGNKDFEEISRGYKKYGMDATVMPFVDDMVSLYQSADLLVCRAGATSLAEITAMGKASILVPFPSAANDHQMKNALKLKETGAAEIVPDKDLSGKLLSEIIIRFFRNPKKIEEMENRSVKLGNNRAAEKIVDICTDLVLGEEGKNA